MKASEVLLTVIEARLMQSHGTPVSAVNMPGVVKSMYELLSLTVLEKFTIHELLTDIKHLFGIGSQGVVMSDHARKTCGRALRASDRPIREVAGILTVAAIRLVTAVSGESILLSRGCLPTSRLMTTFSSMFVGHRRRARDRFLPPGREQEHPRRDLRRRSS